MVKLLLLFTAMCSVCTIIFAYNPFAGNYYTNPVAQTQPLVKLKPPTLKVQLPSVQPAPKVQIKRKPKVAKYLVYHPSPLVRTFEAAKAIEEMYRTSATSVANQLDRDLQKLKKQKNLYWSSRAEKNHKLAVIRNQEKRLNNLKRQASQEARERADSWAPDSNWHNKPVKIRTGPAFRQLQSISINGW